MEKPDKFDEVVTQDGVRVLIDSKALFSIIGSEMDWKEDALRYVNSAPHWIWLANHISNQNTYLPILCTVPNLSSRTRISKTLVVVESRSTSLAHDRHDGIFFPMSAVFSSAFTPLYYIISPPTSVSISHRFCSTNIDPSSCCITAYHLYSLSRYPYGHVYAIRTRLHVGIL